MLQSKKSQTELANQIKNDSHLRERLLKLVSTPDSTKIDAESREADPEWFEGLYLSECSFHFNYFKLKTLLHPFVISSVTSAAAVHKLVD